jgi:long-chain acyl-CoA synthetase
MLSHLFQASTPSDIAAVARVDGPDRVAITVSELRDRVQNARERIGHVQCRSVLIETPRPFDFLVNALAVFDAGGVVLPVNLRTPKDQRKHDVFGAVARVSDEGVERLPSPRAYDPDIRLILSTSGSSGKRRHAMLTERGILANIEAILSYLPLRDHRRPAIVLPLWYSYALVGQALTAFRAGATPILLNDEPFPIRQLQAMAQHEVDGLSSVPTSLRRLTETARELSKAERPKLAYLASAGEPLGRSTIALMRKVFPGVRLFNQYGLTEASPRVAAISDDDIGFDAGSVGRPLPGITIEAWHSDGRPVLASDPAELVVTGPSVMRGYLDDPEATAAVLTERGLRTGDLGYFDSKGRVYVVGRKDDVVKVSGERISLIEVGETLCTHAGTEECIVLGAPDEYGTLHLVAFARTLDLPGLKRFARDNLAPVARPVRWVGMSAIPRNTSGKVDRAELRGLAARALDLKGSQA